MSRILSRVSAFVFTSSMLLWALSICLYARSKYRSDVVTIITPGQHCVVLESDMDGVGLGFATPWIGHRFVAWSTARAVPKENFKEFWDSEECNELRGPQFVHNWDRQGPSKVWMVGTRFPAGICYTHIPKLEICYHERDGLTATWVWRRLYFDPTEFDLDCKTVDQNLYYVEATVWELPWVTAIIPTLWLLTDGRRRGRRWSRWRKGLCVNCGYDLRETPASCPECGRIVSDDWKRRGGWRIASVAVAGIILIFALLIRSAANQGGI